MSTPVQHHQPPGPGAAPAAVDQLVTVEAQSEFDLLSGRRSERIFLKLYVAARSSGLLAAISDRDWKTLCTVATYMQQDGSCFPSQAELAHALGCTRQTANERVQSLARFRFQGKPVLLIVKGERSTKGEWSGNGYRVLPIASLRIFDNPAPASQASPAATGSTVSGNADTGTSPTTVSGFADTATADTNQIQSLEQDLSFEVRRVARAQVDRTSGTGSTPDDHARAAVVAAEAPGAPKPSRTQEGAKKRALDDPGSSDAAPGAPPRPVQGDGYQRFKEQAASLLQERRIYPGKIGRDGKQEPERTGSSPAAGDCSAIAEQGSARRSPPGQVLLGDLPRQRHAAIAAAAVQPDRSPPAARSAAAGDIPSPSRGRPRGSAEEREQLAAYLADFARELNDQAPLSSTVSRALRLFKQAGIAPELYGDFLYRAKSITQEHSGQIKTQAPAGTFQPRPKMAYYLAVLQDLLGLKDQPDSPNDADRGRFLNGHRLSATANHPAPATQPRRNGYVP